MTRHRHGRARSCGQRSAPGRTTSALTMGLALGLAACAGKPQAAPGDNDSSLAALLLDAPLPVSMAGEGPPMVDPPPRFCDSGGGGGDIFFPPFIDEGPIAVPADPEFGTAGSAAPAPRPAPAPDVMGPFPTTPPPPPPVPPSATTDGGVGNPGDGMGGDGDSSFPGDGDSSGDGDGMFPGDGDFPFPGDGDCSSSPLGFWHFNDCNPQRTDLQDSSNEGHTAFRTVGLTCDESIQGLAPVFQRSDDLVYTPDQPAFVLDGGVTVAAWIKPNRTNRIQSVFRKRDGGTSAFALLVRGNKYVFVVRLQSGENVAVSAPAEAGEWTHVAATYDNEYVRLYIGGEEVDSEYAPGTLENGFGPLLMGNDITGRRLDGMMDDAWFNNLAAPADTIRSLLCLRQPPTLSIEPVAGPEVEAGTTVPYTLSIKNESSPECAPEQFIVFGQSPSSEFTITPNFQQVGPVAPGEAIEQVFDVTSGTETEPDIYDITLSLFSFSDFSGESSVTATYTVAPPTGCHISSARVITIRDLSVVDDPVRTSMIGPSDDPRVGAWSFGRLMERLSPSAAEAPAITEAVFSSMATTQIVNGFPIEARPQINPLVLDAWPRTPSGELDLAQAPLRLLAIVNRLDLKDLADGKGGEGRLVYGVLDPAGFPMEFTVILEYKISANTEEEYVAAVQSFHALQDLPFPSEEYNAALQALTDSFTGRGALPGAPNDSALIDLRTNEIALSFQWMLREFRLSPAGTLDPAPLFQTPDSSFNFTDTLGRFINQNETAILAETHTAPLSFEGQPFQAASVFNNIDIWSAVGVNNPDARHKFSLNTCNGCHGGETNTAFLHIFPRFTGERSQLSQFHTGTDVFDFETGQVRRLSELGRRRALLEPIVCGQ